VAQPTRTKLLIAAVASVTWGLGAQCVLPAPSGDGVAVPQGPRFELRHGENYFRVDGQPAFVLGRNPAGISPKAYDDHFRHAAMAGERFLRIHFTFIPPQEKVGEIDAAMLGAWDRILDSAEKYGLAVLPVLGVWADWNDGSHGEAWHAWDRNPYNARRGGPAQQPGELFDDTACRRLWLERLESFVQQWSPRRAIVGWEIFSELDLVTGADDARAVDFTERAAAVIRAADPWKRPITASQSGTGEWPRLLHSPALDFVEIHPYAEYHGGRLDDLILTTVRDRLARYGKPVLIGESGLDSRAPRKTLDAAPRGDIGIRHAIWAAMVSGAMNGRALWWQDGYDQFEKVDLCPQFEQASATAVAFARGVDFSGFKPVPCTLSPGLLGAMIGNDKTRVGWFRDAHCEPPDWPVKPVTGQSVTFDSAGTEWHAEFFDPATGKSLGESPLPPSDSEARLPIPEFEGSIAVRLRLISP